MIIFPEGTRFNPNNPEALTSAQDYAKKEGAISRFLPAKLIVLTLLRNRFVRRLACTSTRSVTTD